MTEIGERDDDGVRERRIGGQECRGRRQGRWQPTEGEPPRRPATRIANTTGKRFWLLAGTDRTSHVYCTGDAGRQPWMEPPGLPTL